MASTAPQDESRRLAALYRLGILDTPREERFDRITRLAATLLETPLAVISLVDRKRQWFKSAHGIDISETPRGVTSFCGHAIQGDGPLIVPDAQADVRFAADPLVTGSSRIRFYAGRPLKATEGLCIGTLCVMDRAPRTLSASQLALLDDLACIAEEELNHVKRDAAVRHQLAAIVENSNDAIYSHDLDGTILSWNAGAVRMLGYTAAEAIGKPVGFAVPPGRPSNLARNMARVLRGELVTSESDRLTKDGRVIDVWASRSPIRDSDANVVGVSVILQDITALKRAQLALKASEQRFRATFEQAAVGIAHIDLEHRYLLVNQRYCEIVGYAAAELLHRQAGFFNHPHDHDIGAGQRARLLAGAIDHFSQDKRYVRKDDSVIWVTRTESLARDDAGRPAYLIRVIEDITERMQLQHSLQLTQFSIDHAVDPVFWIRPNAQIFYVNDAACRVLGYTREEMIGKTVSDIDPHFPAHAWPAHWEELKRQRSLTFRSDHYTKAGALIHTEVTANYIQFQGEEYNCAFMRDITGQKQAEATRRSLEAQLRESQKMQAVGTLAGGIAHDFNNILSTIMGNVQLAHEDSANNPAALQSLGEIRNAARRASDLVRQILTFSRRQSPELNVIDLTPLVEETARLLRATLPPRLGLDVRCAANLPPVLANATQIQQVLINLATNAMQAMSGSTGNIVVTLDGVELDGTLAQAHPSLVELYSRRPGPALRLSVRDSGSGMDAATLARIFEPFFTTKPVNEGTGLGLSVVHGIVQGHDGAIVVDSQPGRGTTATVYLPVSAAAASAGASARDTAPAARPGPVPAEGPHVLHIDDDATQISLYKRLFERRGYRVTAHTDPRAALDALREDPGLFDLVLTDYNMPELSGLDVAREVCAINPGVTVAVLSGFVDEILRAQAADAGIRTLISKTEGVEAICAAVQRLTQKASPAS